MLLLVGEIHQAAGGGDKDGVTGGAMPGVVTGPGTYPAAAIVTVLRGGYAVRTPVNMVVTRSAGTTTPTAGPATVRGGTEVTLGPGDSILYPLGVSSLAERSTGPEALEAVAVVLRRPGSEWWTPFAVTGATGRVLLRTALEAVPAGPLAVRLRRLTLAPGAGVPVTPPRDRPVGGGRDGCGGNGRRRGGAQPGRRPDRGLRAHGRPGAVTVVRADRGKVRRWTPATSGGGTVDVYHAGPSGPPARPVCPGPAVAVQRRAGLRRDQAPTASGARGAGAEGWAR